MWETLITHSIGKTPKNKLPTSFNHNNKCLDNKLEIAENFNPAAAGPPRHPPAAGGGGIKLPPFTSAMISSQREEIEKRNFAHIFLNT